VSAFSARRRYTVTSSKAAKSWELNLVISIALPWRNSI
jgi:hypothetical protein